MLLQIHEAQVNGDSEGAIMHRSKIVAVFLALSGCFDDGVGPLESIQGRYVLNAPTLAALARTSRDSLRAHSIEFDGRGEYTARLEYVLGGNGVPKRDSVVLTRGRYAVDDERVQIYENDVETLILEANRDKTVLSGLSGLSVRLVYNFLSR
jgi:hypothetical protein